jgi:HK97 family phage prohead protease|tara:strand:- start:53 stop:2107 length:2055 start_codon:yes stop_codon:yes gene_type:complete
MERIYNWTSTFKSLGDTDDGGVEIKGSASTNAVDRAGDIIERDAWTKGGLENFKTNPIILFNHNYDKPIGRATNLKVTDNGLEISAKISKAAGDVTQLIKDGVLGAFSVGFKVKDADYMTETDGYKIKDAELFEVSVVSLPCNQGATFGLSKSFGSMEDYNKHKQTFYTANSDDSADAVEIEQPSTAKATTETNMSKENNSPESNPEFNLESFATEAAEKAVAQYAMKQAELKAAELKLAEEAAEKAATDVEVQKASEEAKQEEQKTVIQAGLTGAEKLMSDVEKRVNDNYSNLETVVKSLEAQLAEKSEEIMNIRDSKRHFADRQGNNSDWKKSFEQDIADAKFAGLATGRGWETPMAKSLMEKVNQMSGVDVSSADFEQVVSTNIERDIQNELVLAPLFREIPMTSANMIIPILPDSGYAEFTGNQAASGSAPHGNLDPRGDAYDPANGAGIVMAERTLSTKKLISQSYLGNETEEDAIMPILPLIRESMVRSHARGIENAILAGDDADGAYGTSGAAFEGLLHLARNDSDFTQSATAFASDTVTAAELLSMRKNMGKYGVNPSDVVYIVSQRTYFELLEDAEFQDANLVGDMATKLSGEIGQVFGSRVLLCDEFATPAVSKFAAIAVNPRNYVLPRLRGVTVESDYEVAAQRRVLVASQRIGFTDLIDGVTSKWGHMYKGS